MYIIPTMHNFIYLISINDDWPGHIKKLKQVYPELTEEDLKLVPGKENDLLIRIAARLNKSRKEVIGIIKKGQIYRY